MRCLILWDDVDGAELASASGKFGLGKALGFFFSPKDAFSVVAIFELEEGK